MALFGGSLMERVSAKTCGKIYRNTYKTSVLHANEWLSLKLEELESVIAGRV